MSKPKFDRNYARRKLELVLRDLRDYTADEFWREISRIASGATGLPSAEQLKEHTKELEAELAAARAGWQEAIAKMASQERPAYDEQQQRIAKLEAINLGLTKTLVEMTSPAVQGEPAAYAVFAGNGNIRIWCADPVQVESLRQQYGESLQPLHAAPQPAEQPTFSVGTDLSDGKLSVVVMKHENNITWVIHSEVIQLAEHQPDVAQLVEALEEALHHVVISPGPVRGGFIQEIDAALAAYRKQGGEQ